MKTRLILLIPLFFAIAFPVNAQDTEQEMTPKKYENVEWYGRALYKIYPMKLDSAYLVLKNHIIPAFRESGMEVDVYSHMTGEYQIELLFPMPDGPAALEWEVAPVYIELIKYINNQEGGSKALPYWGSAIMEAKADVLMKRLW